MNFGLYVNHNHIIKHYIFVSILVFDSSLRMIEWKGNPVKIRNSTRYCNSRFAFAK